MFKQSLKSWPIVLSLIGVLLLSYFSGFSRFIDRSIYDSFLSFKQQSSPDDVVIIAIDEKSIDAFGKWPWHRDVHVQLLRQLKRYHSKLIAIDVLFTEEDADLAVDENLVSTVSDLGNIILPIYLGGSENKNLETPIFKKYPYPDLAQVSAALGHVQISPDKDGIGRSVYLQIGLESESGIVRWWPHFSLMANEILNNKNVSAFKEDLDYADFEKPTRILKKDKKYIPYIGPAGSFKTISYMDVVLGRISSSELENKVIFVGAIATGLGDSVATPVTKNGVNLPGVELNANIFQAIRSDSFISWLGEKPSLVLSIFLCVMLAILGVWFSAGSILFASIIVSVAALAFDYLLLIFLNVWMPMASILIGSFLVYPLWSFFRLSQTFVFLKSEILQAENTPTLFSEPKKIEDIQARLNGLLSSGRITAWWIDPVGGGNLIVGGMVPPVIEPALLSEGVLSLSDFSCKWSVVWVDAENKAQLHERLDAAMVFQKPFFQGGLPKELISAQIDQLQEANKQVRGMYGMTRETLNNMEAFMFVFDALGRVLYTNGNIKKQFSFSDIHLEDTHIFTYVDHIFDLKKNVKASINQLLFKDGSIYKEIESLDGRYFLMQANKAQGLLKDGAYLMTLTDISAMRYLQNSKEEALQFLSHDLKSPMVTIIALLEQTKLNGAENDIALIDECRSIARKSLDFSNNYLQVVRAEDNELSFVLLDAEGIFETSIAAVFLQAKEKDINIKRDWPEDVYWVNANVNLLNRALQNLLCNAIKYSPKGADVTVSLVPSGDKDLIGFSVLDHGMGIPENEIPQLFQRFKRASNAMASAIEGTGLGLRFVNVVAKRHSGWLEVKSELNKGSQFILWLPNIEESVE